MCYVECHLVNADMREIREAHRNKAWLLCTMLVRSIVAMRQEFWYWTFGPQIMHPAHVMLDTSD